MRLTILDLKILVIIIDVAVILTIMAKINVDMKRSKKLREESKKEGEHVWRY